MATSQRFRRHHVLLPFAAVLLALTGCAPPIGGGHSSASGSSGPVPGFGDHAVVFPFCSIAGGHVAITLSGNTTPIRVSVVPEGESRMTWAGGVDDVPAGGGTLVTEEPFPAGTCGRFTANLQLGGCPWFCPPLGSSFDWLLTW